MTMKREDVENAFKGWLAEGYRVGALAEEHDHELSFAGTAFVVFEIGTDEKRYHMSSGTMPHLGKTARSAHDILNAMRQAWAMIPRGTEAK